MPSGAAKDSNRLRPWIIVAARGERMHQFAISPLALLSAGLTLPLLIAAVVIAAWHLYQGDMANSRESQLLIAYQGEVMRLQGEVEQLRTELRFDRQLIEERVSELMERQTAMDLRQSQLVGPARDGTDGSPPQLAQTHRALDAIESVQAERLQALIHLAQRQREQIAALLAEAGLEIDDAPEPPSGGPFIPPQRNFAEGLSQLTFAMLNLEGLRAAVRTLPLANPAPGAKVTSNFGPRNDPILKRPAYHSGLDLRAAHGDPILAAGDGVVIFAGWHRGYGRMIEIDHGQGITSRYAHLNKVLIRQGEKIAAGAHIGTAGNTGRSTGPHLHYEVRMAGRAVDPVRFIRLGRKLDELF